MVYGMPREAAAISALDDVAPLQRKSGNVSPSARDRHMPGSEGLRLSDGRRKPGDVVSRGQ